MKLPKIPTGPYAHVVLSLLVGIAIGVSAIFGLQTYAAPQKVQMVAAVPVNDAVRSRLVALEGIAGSTLEEVKSLRRDIEKQKAPPPVVKAKAAGK